MAALYLHNALFIPESTNPARAQVHAQVHDLNSSLLPAVSLPSPPPPTSRTRFPFSTQRRGGSPPPPAAFQSVPTSSPPSTPPPGLRQPQQASHFQTASTSTIISTNAYEYSHPTEPLLQSTTSESVVYFDLLSRQPTHPHGPQRTQAWDMGLTLDGDPPTSRERKGLWERAVRRRLKRLKYLKWILEAALGVWAVYNSVRYFLAFAIYRSVDGQIASLVQGICTTLTVALLACALVLDFFQPQLLLHHIRSRSILLARTFLVYISTFLLLGPAVVNFALLFAWRHHNDSETTPGSRCFVDIDFVWSPSASTNCKHPPWGVWITLASVRLTLTLIIIILYHLISFSYERTRRPPKHRPTHHPHSDSMYGLTASAASPPMVGVSSSPVAIHQLQLEPDQPHHKASDATLTSQSGSKTATLTHQPSFVSHQLSRVSSAGSSTEHGGDSEIQDVMSSRPSNGSGSNASSTATTIHVTNSAGVVVNNYSIPSTSTAPHPSSSTTAPLVGESPSDLYGFADRFHAVVNQISRETDEGLEFARSQNPIGYPTYDDLHLHSGEIQGDVEVDLDRYYHYSPPPPTLGYDEFGRPYPPEEPVRFLNSIIRRMPTIESMGSREVASWTSSARSSFQQTVGDRTASLRSVLTGSRPPTRSMSLTDHTSSVSEPSSRRNSLRAGAELIASMGRTSEVGELVDRNDVGAGAGMSASGSGSGGVGVAGGSGAGRRASLGSSNGHGTGGSYPQPQSTMTSRSTMTFYTAVSSSSPSSPSYSPILEQGVLSYSPVQTHAHSSLNSSSGNSRTPTEESVP
ncbi:hypothetical protein BDN72DRAFT_308207 [Pluteus cervinus]|uniref:Uncharacterized protein n=1 Tax=Pluteus cervinus TaxID=181527 RepID=A0ACD3AD08_9AGAR|nr:hypothetical protein BDN72DRAFT_308207 [Pluteus cervinus]